MMLPAISHNTIFLTAAKPRKVNTEKNITAETTKNSDFCHDQTVEGPFELQKTTEKSKTVTMVQEFAHH